MMVFKKKGDKNMAKSIPYSEYEIYEKGHFDCGLALFVGYDPKNEEYNIPIYADICYSSGNECHLGRDFTEFHREAVNAFCEDYDLVLVEE